MLTDKQIKVIVATTRFMNNVFRSVSNNKLESIVGWKRDGYPIPQHTFGTAVSGGAVVPFGSFRTPNSMAQDDGSVVVCNK